MESAVARVCREGGACVSKNILVRDMDVARPNPLDMSEVVADGLGTAHSCRVCIATVTSVWSSKQRCSSDLVAAPAWLCWLVMSAEGARRKLDPSYPAGEGKVAAGTSHLRRRVEQAYDRSLNF